MSVELVSDLVFDTALIAKYDRSGPRYTSYPTAVDFRRDFGEREYRDIASRVERLDRPLSLYFHLPFCAHACYYCGCTKIVTKDRSRSEPYVEVLIRELELESGMFDARRPVTQLHWGGGTPTFLQHDEMSRLMEATRKHFHLDDDNLECSIEIDPREARPNTIEHLGQLGFNRISLGVQDFDPVVQLAVNRRQTEEETAAVIDAARLHGFNSVSVDLIYGLPFQSLASFGRTVEKVLALAPDRLSVFNYAHLPERFKQQRRIRREDLPKPEEKLQIFKQTAEQLLAAGYVYIGMDHFARPDDELARAQREGTLQRNFQGYSTRAETDLVGFGVSSIGKIGSSYAQKSHVLEDWQRAIQEGRLPIIRGIVLDEDDHLRRDVITQLICNFQLDEAAIEQRHQLSFDDYFAEELTELRSMAQDGLLALEPKRIRVLPRGRLLIRNICMVFDKYQRERETAAFSKVI